MNPDFTAHRLDFPTLLTLLDRMPDEFQAALLAEVTAEFEARDAASAAAHLRLLKEERATYARDLTTCRAHMIDYYTDQLVRVTRTIAELEADANN